ncbi:MAG: hypothetical protein IJ137_11095, partial [Eubacterium sp.]|nr:hypothetical protein [Eubacterium sp.]
MNEKQSIMAGHPARKSLQGIPEIVSPEEERYEIIRQSCISLKKLFARENMDLYHVDCLVLYRIASGVLHIMEELSLRHIFPGLYDLNDICVDLQNGCQVYLLNPDRFQLPGSDQDYEWYPEDERLFGDIDRFDEDAQKLADTRLIYKILVASAKGNVKIPPKETNADYSALFYKTLSPEWKDLFLKEEGVRHDRLKALLSDSIALERESAGYVRRRRYERVKRQFEDTAGPADSDQGDKHQPAVGDPDTSSEHQPVVIDSETGNEHQSSGSVYSMFALLRTETRHSG